MAFDHLQRQGRAIIDRRPLSGRFGGRISLSGVGCSGIAGAVGANGWGRGAYRKRQGHKQAQPVKLF
jgi:hypothetical protein